MPVHNDIDEIKDYKREGEKQSFKSYGWNGAIYFYDDLPICFDGRTIRRDAFKEQDSTMVPIVWNHDHNSADNILKYSEKLWEEIYSNIIKGEKSMKTPVGLNPETYFPGYTFSFGNGEYVYADFYNDSSKYTEKFMDSLKRRSAGILLPKIEKVIFNDPATIVFWEDGTKTVVHATNEPFDKEKGLAMAISKKAYGNNYGYYNIFKKNGAASKDVKSDAQDS